MKKTVIYIRLLIVLTLLPFSVKSEVSEKATASARVLEILQLIKVQDLNFGRVAAGTAGIIELTPDGSRLITGVSAIGESGWTPARFEVRGTQDYEYYIGLPSSITLENGDNSLVIENLVSRPSSATQNAFIGVLSQDSYFTIGGKLLLESSTIPTGTYSTHFEVTVGYN
jgi:hypothetical protein